MSSIAPGNYLPNELLLSILDYLECDDLYQITSVSSRFNRLALIVYFAKRKVHISPGGQIDLPNPHKTAEMLPYLRKAPFVTSIKRLHCGLLQPDKLFLRGISDLTAILQNVEFVEEFVVDFYAGSKSWTPALMKQVNTGNALVNALHDLFTVAACSSRSVTIRNGTALKGVIQKADKSLGGSKTSFLSRLFAPNKYFRRRRGSLTAATKSTQASRRPVSLVQTKGAIRSLEVNSIILISPPFLDWTTQTLNAHSITDLAFGTIESSDVDWSNILTQLYIPSLSRLAFRGHTPFHALIDFMGRHQRITALTVSNFDMSRPTNTLNNCLSDKVATAFRNVRELFCCPQGLAIVFSATGAPFPELRTVSVLWNIGVGQHLRMSVVDAILAPVAHKLRTYRRVVFNLTYRTDVGGTWRMPSFPSAGSTSPAPNVVGALGSAGTTVAAGALACFTEVKLDLTPRADKEGIPDLIKGLAESLTNISQFALDTRARATRPLQENKFLKLYAVHHILKRFAHLRTVCVDGVSSMIVERDDRRDSTAISVWST